MAPAYPPLLPLDQARAIRRLCLHAAWHAANTHVGYEEDAARDLRNLKKIKSCIADTCGSDVASALAQLALSAAWHAVHTLGYEDEEPAEERADEFADSMQSLKEHVGEAAATMGDMASAAAQHAAHRRLGDEGGDEAMLALVALVRAFHRLSTWRRAKWVGVNLGGWLLLEYGPAAPLFQNQGARDNGEWAFTEELRAQGIAEDVFAEHRARHINIDEMRKIAALGINAVRVPFGYWVVSGPSCGDPYLGPCLEQLDRVVAMGSELGLEVLLDLHGNPGVTAGETDNKCCGRDHPEWEFEEWRRGEAIQVLGTVARRYAHAAAVTALQLCNEPSKEIEPRALVEHYVAATRAIRENGMTADRVAVICPLYYTDDDDKEEFFRCWYEAYDHDYEALDNCVIDVHPYYFGDWCNSDEAGPLIKQVADQAHELATRCPASVVGEWSGARPPEIGKRGSGVSRPTQREFFELQLRLWSACTTHGSFFWCWADNSGPDWCLRALAPGRREALAAAAESDSPIWTTSYTHPEAEGWWWGEEAEEPGLELEEADPETALEAVWIASSSPAPSSASLRDGASPDYYRRPLEPVTPMSISMRYDGY